MSSQNGNPPSSINGSSSLLNSDNTLAILGFFVIVIVVFILLLRISVSFMTHIFSPNGHVKLINGMVDGNVPRIFPQDPAVPDATTILRSSNAVQGIEFTWSVWVFIDSVKSGIYQNIFTKGNQQTQDDGLNTPNNAPGLYITPTYNELLVIMNTYEVINEEILIPDIPLNKWLNVIICVKNKTLDVYVNGIISQSKSLIGVPKQNYGDVFVALGGGFDGSISNLWYWNKYLSLNEIQRIAYKGPNTKEISNGVNKRGKSSDYLALQWYTDS